MWYNIIDIILFSIVFLIFLLLVLLINLKEPSFDEQYAMLFFLSKEIALELKNYNFLENSIIIVEKFDKIILYLTEADKSFKLAQADSNVRSKYREGINYLDLANNEIKLLESIVLNVKLDIEPNTQEFLDDFDILKKAVHALYQLFKDNFVIKLWSVLNL